MAFYGPDEPEYAPEPPEDPEDANLMKTPEGMDWKPDQRDATPEPPAYLDPYWVIGMRQRVTRFAATGEWK